MRWGSQPPPCQLKVGITFGVGCGEDGHLLAAEVSREPSKPRLGPRQNYKRSKPPTMLTGICPASHDYQGWLKEHPKHPSGPFKAVARVGIPLGSLSKKPSSIRKTKVEATPTAT